jgi:hypothetical protein
MGYMHGMNAWNECMDEPDIFQVAVRGSVQSYAGGTDNPAGAGYVEHELVPWPH